ncbi:MAG: outer membrane lipid asymmetry maintenance protein MlaD [Gammaproteobacteria bacterium RBG_16_51_14]|nr:MAG: outer membrane lipid asymmetry maintenance protein MlaD [Gammaproteobacteria bacterium RBG_16_51_14]
MRKNPTTEFSVGLFMLLGLACIGYLAIRMGDVDLFRSDNYLIEARFTSVSGLKEGAFVEAAGVRIGKVLAITYEPENALAHVILSIQNNVVITDDATASIRTAGIIGDKFVKITPGGSPDHLESGMEIVETEPSISLEELISKYIFESGK